MRRGDADDAARSFLRHQMSADLLRHEESARKVGFHDGVPLFRRRFQREPMRGHGGVVDERVDAPQFRDRFADGAFDACLGSHVERDGKGPCAGSAQIRHDGAELIGIR
jgi:hypothetical protein